MTTLLASDADLLARIEQFRAEHSIPETTFGRKAASDPNLIAGLRRGRELRRATRAKLLAFMREYTAPESAAA